MKRTILGNLHRLLALLMALMLCLGAGLVLAEEAPAEEEVVPEGRIEVVYWNLLGGGDGAILKKIVEEFNATSDTIYVRNMTQDWGQYYTKLRTAALGGTSPDIAISHADNVLGLYEAGILMPIDSEMERLGVEFDFSQIGSPSIDSTKIDDHYYAIPQDILTNLYFYNKSLLEPLGLLDEEGKPNYFGSLADFQQACKKMEEATPDLFAHISYQDGHMLGGTWFGFYAQTGADPDYLSDDRTQTEFDEEKALESLRLLQEFYSVVPPQVTGAFDLFAEDKVYGMMEGTWTVSTAIERIGTEKLGIVPFPQLVNKELPSYSVYSHCLTLPVNANRDDETTKAALEFIKYFIEHDEKWAEAGHLPAYKPAYDTDFFKELPLRKGYEEAINSVVPFPAAPTLELYTAPEINIPLEKLVKGETDVEACFAEIVEGLNSVLAD